MDIELESKNNLINFVSISGDNVRHHYELNVGIKLHGDRNYLIYDEIKLWSTMDINITKEILRANVKAFKME